MTWIKTQTFWGAGHESARVHHVSRWSGGSLADRRAWAAGGDAGDRFPERPIVNRDGGYRGRIPPGLGYIEGKNLTIEYRWAEGRDRLPALAAELIGRRVVVIAAIGGEVSGLAAKAATATIPIVFTGGGDPVELGLVASLNNPGGNVTGVTFIVVDSATKRLGLLRQLAPSAIAIAMLIKPDFPSTAVEAAAVQVGARSLGLQVKLLYAGTSSEIDAAFATFVPERPDALLVGGDPFLLGRGTRSCCWRSVTPFRRSIRSASTPMLAA